jgi:type II secretory pathway predicted ATPase ExeA
MRVKVMQHYGLTQPLSQAGYYETRHHQQLIKDIHIPSHFVVKSFRRSR